MPKYKLLLLLNILFNLSLKESRFICLLVFKDTVCIFIFAVKQDYEAIHNNNIPSSVWFIWQLQRLGECERMLVAMELAGWLNESNLALQAVVQCYGLLVPLLHYKISSIPLIQVRYQGV